MVKNIYSKTTLHGKIKHYDILILGAGPAGLTAALYAARYNLSVAVIAKSLGGTANLAEKVDNWPGYIGSGRNLMKKFKRQAEDAGARFLEAEINSMSRDENGFVADITLKNEPCVIHGKSVIVAFGTERKRLDLEGEKEFIGKGVSYCATCDGIFFKNKIVAVVGGADAAVKTALLLSEIAQRVYLIHRKKELGAEPLAVSKLKRNKKIKILYNTIITKISGDRFLEKIDLEKNGKQNKEYTSLNIDGLFIEIGGKPMIDVVVGLGLNFEKDHISTDKTMKTNVSGVFAAGDATSGHLKQIVTAAGEGAIAAKSAYDYLRFEYGK